MSLQETTFRTAHVQENEIVKANDFEFAFEQLVENVSKSTQMMLESRQDFVINGKVLPYQGMNVQISPIYGVCKSTGIPFGRTEVTAPMDYGFEESSNGRIDIIEVKGEWETYDEQQRAFNDPDTDIQTYEYVDTKKLLRPVFVIKKGTEGTSVAPEVDAGYVKLAEVVIRANNSTITEEDIKNITADIAGLANEDWTTEPDITYNIGYISDVNERFRVQHNEDGTHKDNVINSDSLDIGTGSKQINANILPIGGNISIPTETISATDSILSTITKAAAMITSLYNAYLKYGTYGFNGELSISSVADNNNNLTNPIKINAAGDGTATIKIGSLTVLSIDSQGKLSTNGYTASGNNNLITKAVTDSISTSLSNLTTRVTNLENQSEEMKIYANKVLSTSRYTIDSLSIEVATTANITLSGLQTIDGVALEAAKYVLVKNQTDPKNNGIYSTNSSAWSRVTGYTSPSNLKGKLFIVQKGTANSGKVFYIPNETFINGASFGSDEINFFEFIGSIKNLGNKIAVRDSSGRIKTTTPSADEDAVNKGFLTIYNLGLPSGIVKATCSTAAGTAAKTVALTGFSLVKGAKLLITFTNANTASSALTLNVNSTGAKTIYINGVVSSSTNKNLSGTYIVEYDGTYWKCDNEYMTTSARNASYATTAGSASSATTSSSCSGNAATATDLASGSVLSVGKGGTGQTTAEAIVNNTIQEGIKGNDIATDDVTDTMDIITTSSVGYTSTAKGLYRRSATKFWNYIQSKISTILYLTASYYGGKAATATDLASGSVLSVGKGGTGYSTKLDVQGNYGIAAYCETAAGTQAKTAVCDGFILTKGSPFRLYIKNTSTVTSPTLNINSTGAKSFFVDGVAPTTSNVTAGWYNCIYDGVYYQLYKSDLSVLPSSGCAVCNTPATTADKVASLPGYVLKNGTTFFIEFINTNTVASALTLNINGTGAKTIYINEGISSNTNFIIPNGIFCCFYENNKYYIETSWGVPFTRRSERSDLCTGNANTATSATSSGCLSQSVIDVDSANDAVGVVYSLYSTSKMPGTYGNLIQMQTGTGLTTRWGVQMIFPTGGANPQWRSWTNTKTFGNWNTFITSKNIGSQSVQYATTAGSASSASSATTATQASYSRQGAYCSTAANVQLKEASMMGYVLQSGATFPITFENTNSYDGTLQLKVNGTSAKNIWINGTLTTSGYNPLPAGTYICRYNGSAYEIETAYSITSARTAGTAASCSGNAVTSSSCSGNAATATDLASGSVLAIGKGGTGQTTAQAIVDEVIQAGLGTGDSNCIDNTDIITSNINGYSTYDKRLYRRKATFLWEYIKSQISTILGLTASSYSGNAATATTAGSCTGNAATATLANNLSIFNCDTSSGTAAKTLAVPNFVLSTGARLFVTFSNANTASSPTLNVNSTGAKSITIGSSSSSTTPTAASSSSSAWNGIASNTIYEAYYDGSYWRLTKANGNMLGVTAWYFSSTSGYIVFTNGLKIQWKVHTTGVSSNSVAEITLPLSITTSNVMNIQAIGSYETSSNGTVMLQVREIKSTSISVRNNGNSTSTKVFLYVVSY